MLQAHLVESSYSSIKRTNILIGWKSIEKAIPLYGHFSSSLMKPEATKRARENPDR